VDEASGKSSPPQVPPSQSLSLPRLSESISVFVGGKLDQGNRGAIATRQVARENTSATRMRVPSEKIERRTSRRKPSIHTTIPPSNPTLIVQLGNGPGRTSPTKEETQGPSPVDYSVELEAEFPKEMVSEMQGNTARKARRTIIGRMLGGRATFKELHESLKLHLPTTYVSATLLTRGFFLVLFENEEGATQTRKLAPVEWNGLSLSFSRYNPNFDANAQGAEALLTHTIKVQFPDLHEQFKNPKTLTIMASKIGEVFNIEAADSYIWPILAKEKNAQKETLVHYKNQNRPSLPFNMRITGSVEVTWTQESAWVDLMQRLETKLEEKILRYRLTLKDRPQLEWSWQKEPSRGRTECTILAHIDSGSNALSIQNKQHLHWKVLDSSQGMSNEMEFLAQAHNLLMKTEAAISEHQECKNQSTSIQASLQVARKKRFTKLNLNFLDSPPVINDGPANSDQEEEDGSKDGLARDTTKEAGSFGSKAARNRLTYV